LAEISERSIDGNLPAKFVQAVGSIGGN